MKRILIFGDSIVWGADDLEAGGWVERFKIHFKKTEKFNEVFNLGNPGEDTDQLLARIGNECSVRIKPENRPRDLVIIQTGLNDSQYILSKNDFRVHPNKFKQNIRELIKISEKFVSRIVFIGLTPVDESKVNPLPWNKDRCYKNENIKKYNEIIKSFHSENKVYFIEILEKFINFKYKPLLNDGVHLKPGGHQKIFEIVKDFLVENKLI
jgi:lysophospholipase L1-like esterase